MELIILITWIVIALFIAYYIGTKRYIGFGWSLYFCLFLSPVVGVVIALLSPKKGVPTPQKSNLKIRVGWLLIVIAVLNLINIFTKSPFDKITIDSYKQIIIAFGYCGLGYYLIQLGKTNFYIANV